MNIKQAKEEIKNTIKAYLLKNSFGAYEIPMVRQRPVLLIGPPGIGKTAVMEQAARECKIAFVSYTITHHTRQSAVGLPMIERKTYDSKEYSITEYTMSEIIASIYNKIEATGLKEGLLFIDEINCVSETLAPTMLQFLQGKTFGSHKVPEGWIITAAGNPPEYNRAVKEFDIVTLDRVKRIEVKEDFSVWKEYGCQQLLNGSILSYLEIRKENFYHVEMTPEGSRFVTARGWEDLSEILNVYEALDLPVTAELAGQYIQVPEIARDFALYYELYQKYKEDYRIDDILQGTAGEKSVTSLKEAGFDERISVIGLLLSALAERFSSVDSHARIIDSLYHMLRELKQEFGLTQEEIIGTEGQAPEELLRILYKKEEKKANEKKAASGLERREEQIAEGSLEKLLECLSMIKREKLYDPSKAFERLKCYFQKEQKSMKEEIHNASADLGHVFDYIERVFGESQEMVIFLTGLTTGVYSMRFIRDYGCEQYYKYNKSLLFQERRQGLLAEIEEYKKEI